MKVRHAGAALIDTWWLAKLGSDALAGMALVWVRLSAFSGWVSASIFALLGAGKLFWPILGSIGRAVVGGAVAVFALQSMTAMFVLLAIALIVSGVLPLIELRKARWAV